MASSIDASTSGAGGVITTADNTGILQLKSAGTTVSTINAYGIGLGTGVPSSGIGITFPATQSASSDANTLDDYEEGTFTPGFDCTSSSPSLTYAERSGYYIKIGKMVFISLKIEANIVSSQGNGSLNITGLPFTAIGGGAGGTYSAITTGYFASWAGSQAPVGALVFTGSTNIRPYYMTAIGGNRTDCSQAALGNSMVIYVAGCYQASA